MSLKSFHIFFIAVSSLLAFGFAYWLFRQYAERSGATLLLFGFTSVLVGTGLIFYGIRFLKKLKHVSYL